AQGKVMRWNEVNPAWPDQPLKLYGAGSKRSIRETLSLRIEYTRQYYLQALGFLEKRDTMRAALSFESAISEISLLNSMNGVERYDEYTTMLQSLCDDYERYVRPALRRTAPETIVALRTKISSRAQQRSSRQTFQPLVKSPNKKSKARPPLVTTVPLPNNEHVTRCVDFLVSEKGHKYFARWIERTSQWFPLLKGIAKEEGVPEELVHIAMVESGLDPRSTAHSGRGVGLWHCTREVADRYGLRITPWVDERRDPLLSTRACLRYLRDLQLEVHDWHLAIAAYKAGIDVVKAAQAKSGIDNADFWTVRKELPRETREYVPMVIAAMMITMRYEDYGFGDWEMSLEAPVTTDTVTVRGAVYLPVIARCAGISTDSLQKINPELLGFMTPPDGSFTMNIPRGTRKTFLENLDEVPAEEQLPWVLRTVEKNETLAMIVTETSTLPGDICALNGFDSPSVRLREDQVLRIPKELRKKNRFSSFGTDADPSRRTGASAARSEQAPDETMTDADTATAQSRTFTPVEQYQQRSGRGSARHTVKRGETLASIATMYGTTVNAVLKANRMRSAKALRSGQRLRIPVANVRMRMATRRDAESAAPTGPAPIAYVVTRSDSLQRICSRFGIDENRLRMWNPDFTDSALTPGRVLTIYPDRTGDEREGRSSDRTGTTSSRRVHAVRKGETLSVIARKYGIPLKRLQALNGGTDRIFVGKKVRLR
ncbi:MAG: LysM peptidoglycan-binding domain-containing protein, partial [Candidatus Kapaibacterium sp.]